MCVLENPHQCKEGHLFCFSCISAALRTTQKCPVCQLYLTVATLSKNRAIDDQVNALLVHCVQSTEPDGCYWYGALFQRKAHLIKCPLQLVDCQMNVLGACKDCSGQVMRRDEVAHYLANTMNLETLRAVSKNVFALQTEYKTMKDAVVHGHSVVADSLGSIYSGEILNGMKHGTGTMKYACATKSYAGQWERNVYHGHGIMRVGGAFHCGVFQDGLRHGQFHSQYSDGSTFDGKFENDQRISGSQVYSDGLSYTGDWCQGKRHGKGKLLFSSGTIYVGGFVNGRRSGHGTYSGSDGYKYEGGWLEDNELGFGSCHFVNGGEYKGEWVNGDMHGRGVYKYKNGDVFDGEWQSDKRNGHGVYIYKDGRVYTGLWKDDKEHGKGSMKYKKGKVVKGTWVKGVLQK